MGGVFGEIRWVMNEGSGLCRVPTQSVVVRLRVCEVKRLGEVDGRYT